jgi:hypothetical protein
MLWMLSPFPPSSKGSYRNCLVFSDVKYFIKIFSKNKCP